MSTGEPIISADSHVAETEEVFADIEPAFRDRRPRAIYDEKAGALLAIPDIDLKVPMGLLCTGGRPPEEFRKPVTWEEIHSSGYDPKARLELQDQEGIRAEIIYPSVGMVLCNHPDPQYKRACFAAYNRWLAGFCASAPERLVGLGVASLCTMEEGVRELEEIKKLGFRGVMLPGTPDVKDYHDRCYDPIWEACVDLDLPVSFHILTSRGDLGGAIRGPALAYQVVTVRGNQNIMMMLIFGGVFRAPSESQGGLRGGGRWLGPALQLPHGSRLGAAPLPPARRPAREATQRVLQRAHLSDLSGRLQREVRHRSRKHGAPHVGQRLPSQRRYLSTHPRDHRTGHRGHDRRAQRRAILHDNVADLYGLS